jgi:hypothetical protein
LPRDRELEALIAVLEHPNQSLRRYAIQRLGELDDATAMPALRSRLELENNVLRPVLENSIAALQRNDVAGSVDWLTGIKQWFQAGGFKAWLESLPPAGRLGLAVTPVLGLLLLMITRMRKRRARVAADAEMRRLLNPSDELLDAMGDEAEHDDMSYESDDLDATPAPLPTDHMSHRR